MTRRVLLAAADGEIATRVKTLAAEAGSFEVVATAADTHDVAAILGRTELDAVILHDGIGPLPVLELVRQLASQHPSVGFLVVAKTVTSDLLHQALRAGARDVLGQPLTVEALSEAVVGAAAWSNAVRERLDDERLEQYADRIGGRIVCVAGAKGGVGTSTVAVHLALAAAAQDAERPVCFAELDLQNGDVRALLEVSSKRSIGDLVAVAEEVTVRSLDDTLYIHSSGLRVLLAPENGEDGEDVSADAMRQIVAALKFQYDLVVCDVGSVLTDASAVAVELASEAYVVTTPDVPGLRAANRTLQLWERLHVREDAAVILNRVHKDSEIQPDFARRVLRAPVLETTLPSAFRDLEAALNTGEPSRLEAGSMSKAIAALAEETNVVTPPEPKRRLRLRGNSERRDERALAGEKGQVTVEMMGSAVIVVLILLALWQIVLVGYTYELAGNSARKASRAWAVGESKDTVRKQATDPLPGAWKDSAKVDEQKEGVAVTLTVPLIIPGTKGPIDVTDTKRTVKEGSPLPNDYEDDDTGGSDR